MFLSLKVSSSGRLSCPPPKTTNAQGYCQGLFAAQQRFFLTSHSSQPKGIDAPTATDYPYRLPRVSGNSKSGPGRARSRLPQAAPGRADTRADAPKGQQQQQGQQGQQQQRQGGRAAGAAWSGSSSGSSGSGSLEQGSGSRGGRAGARGSTTTGARGSTLLPPTNPPGGPPGGWPDPAAKIAL